MLKRATLLLLLLLPGFALGQTVTALVTTQGTRGQANRSECASTSSVSSWTINASITPVTANADKWRLATVATSTGCSTSGAIPTGVYQDVLATGSTQVVTTVPVATMATNGGVTTCTQASDVQIALCVYYLPGGSTTSWQLAAQGTFNFQMAIPPKPVISGSTPGDSQLTIAVVPGTTTSTETATTSITYTVTCIPSGGSTGSTGGPGNAGNIVCSGLTNGTAYTVTALGYSAAGNVGPVSDTLAAGSSTTPLPFMSFWEFYKLDGGVETGGCGTGGAGTFAPALALLGFLAIRRRRP